MADNDMEFDSGSPESSAVLDAILQKPEKPDGQDKKAEAAKGSEADLEADNPEPKIKSARRESHDEVEETDSEDIRDEEAEEIDDDTEAEEETETSEASEEEQADEIDDDDENYDDYIVEVVVDGEAMEVSLKDLKSNFSANQYIEKNIQHAVEKRKEADKLATGLSEVYQQTYNKLQQLSSMLDELAVPEEQIDWNRLKVEDPALYLVKREEEREIRARKQAVEQEAQKVQQQQAQLQAEAMKRLLQGEAELLAQKLPGISDPKQGPKLKERFVSVAAHYGYTPEEVGTVIDHRALLVLNDAAKWREYQANKKKAVESGHDGVRKKIQMKSTKSSTPQRSQKRLADKLRDKARRTGKPDDVAATLLVRK